MKKKSTFYLVGNAHLDPVWQWRWQEGSSEAKATIRSALDRMKEFPDFVFVCSSSVVYRWVEEFAPSMFEELKMRVKEGRFKIVGGMYVQPDCNNPSGESFARQTLYAQRYFKEKLGVTAKVGYNVDSFGHNLMMPQILKKSGMDSYIFMRPASHEKHLESDLFNWISPDGSCVSVHRIPEGYGYNFRSIEQLEARMDEINEKTVSDSDATFLFYGVGNHGGGPTIQNLQLLDKYKKEHPEVELIYSDVSDFFDYVKKSGIKLPEHRDDLQHHAAGCYATLSAVKNGIRRGECNLTAAESFSMLANLLCNRRVRSERFEEAWNNILFLQFHDSMGGCSIREVHDDSAYMYGAALNTAAVEENSALQTVSWQINTAVQRTGFPIVLFNSHGFDVDETVRVFRSAIRMTDHTGADIPYQKIHSTTEECFFRTDTIFKAHVPAMGYAVYYINDDWVPQEEQLRLTPDSPEHIARAVEYAGYRSANNHDGTVLENDIYRIEFELHTGYIISFKDKRTGEEIITDRAAVPVVVDEYYHDTWSHSKTFFTDYMARFSDAEVTVTESGPIRATVKVVSRYGDSSLTQYFSLIPGSDKLFVSAEVDWHEKHKMLKTAWPMRVEKPKAYYEIPFGVIERPTDGEEEPGLQWTAVKGENGGYALINSDTYSSSVKDSTIFHTVLRSPIYGDHGGPRTAESEFTEQGKRKYSYELMPVGESWAPVIRAAKQFNKPLTLVMETWHSELVETLSEEEKVRVITSLHSGRLSNEPYSSLKIDAENIMLSACKRSEDGLGMVLRLYETDGRKTHVTVSGDMLRVPLEATFTPWSVNTYYLADTEDEWKEVLLTEYDF